MLRIATLAAALALASTVQAAPRGDAAMAAAEASHRASGHFDVEIVPGAAPGEGLARFMLKKTFHGGLEGTSAGEMLSAGAPKSGSAGYVAIEMVKARLDGRSGEFALQQYGLMTAGAPEMRVSIVPGSGTGELAGITGEMTVDPAANHAYVLTYRLPAR